MQFTPRNITLRDGREAVLRLPEPEDAEVMVRYLEAFGIWGDMIPIVIAMADRTAGGLLELAYYVLDQGKALSQTRLVEKAMSLGGRGETARALEEWCRTDIPLAKII